LKWWSKKNSNVTISEDRKEKLLVITFAVVSMVAFAFANGIIKVDILRVQEN
jgi:hypothetical protein